MDIWVRCGGHAAIRPIHGELVRVVESQEQIATNALVDSLDEQALLEELIEASKPPPPVTMAKGELSYLFTTPFRYPPLKHGSRFGGRFEPALFYGAQTVSAALAETAYYRLVFWDGMADPPPAGRLTSQLSAFGARYSTSRGVQLQQPPFDAHRAALTDPTRYGDTQRLGAAMRAEEIEAFEYASARDPDGGVNVALFNAAPFVAKGPDWQQPWLCDLRADGVSFYNKEQGTAVFERRLFLVDGILSTPAL